MSQGRTDSEFMKYFPSSFMKKNPPSKYFWQIYSTVESQNFQKQYNFQLERAIARIKPPARICILEEHRLLLQKKKEENIKLALSLRKTGVAKNIVYIKKTKKSRNFQATLDTFLQGKSNIIQEAEEIKLGSQESEDKHSS